tara:strand:+ start:66997 stop:67308 length:312 start_codon:yes stop_codon:yes gene_type:complete
MESEQDKLRYLGKLERCKNMLQYFKTRIDSYLYEPSTMALFETKAYLKDKIKQLVDVNEGLLNYMQVANDLLPDQFQSVDFHMKETAELENSVIEYTSMFGNS